ncbi:centromere protein S isoform 2-T2 [Pholidichthys leucotaenia]
MSVDAEETRQRLKAAVHYTVGRLCQKIEEDNHRKFSRQVVAAIAETTFRQCVICPQMYLQKTWKPLQGMLKEVQYLQRMLNFLPVAVLHCRTTYKIKAKNWPRNRVK